MYKQGKYATKLEARPWTLRVTFTRSFGTTHDNFFFTTEEGAKKYMNLMQNVYNDMYGNSGSTTVKYEIIYTEIK